MKGRFRHESGVEVELESREPRTEWSITLARLAFVEEAERRLGAIIAGEWAVLEVVESDDA